jgi:diguanylate cyclase (GGDEF)-like protein
LFFWDICKLADFHVKSPKVLNEYICHVCGKIDEICPFQSLLRSEEGNPGASYLLGLSHHFGDNNSMGGECFSHGSPLFWVIIAAIMVAVIGGVDILTGSEMSVSFFYLIPICLVTWVSGRKLGLIFSLVSAGIWFLADMWAGGSYSQPFLRYWNALMRLGIFCVVALLLPLVKMLGHEKELARTDYLTGIANRFSFFEVAQTELARSSRYKHPFTIAYIDIDGFKNVNDRFGHKTGDELLCVVVNQIKSKLRRADFIARMGGDEFIVILPETDHIAAKVIFPKIHAALLDEMRRREWPVTFSIGVITCLKTTCTVEELVRDADELMYSVKKETKNDIAYAVYSD